MSRKGKTSLEQRQLKCEIDIKRNEIKRLQELFTDGSEKLQLFRANEKKIEKIIDEAATHARKLEEEFLAKKSGQGSLSGIEEHYREQHVRNRLKLLKGLKDRELSADELETTAEDLELFEREIEQKIAIYKDTIASREREVEEARRTLEKLEEEEAKMILKIRKEGDKKTPLEEEFMLSQEERSLALKIRRLKNFLDSLNSQIGTLCKNTKE